MQQKKKQNKSQHYVETKINKCDINWWRINVLKCYWDRYNHWKLTVNSLAKLKNLKTIPIPMINSNLPTDSKFQPPTNDHIVLYMM
jgi:hypothetical protein